MPEAGCFSWCPLSKRDRSIKGTSKENSLVRAPQDKKSSSNPKEVVPTKLDYATSAGIEAIKVLKSAAGLIPVPLIQDAILVALKVVEACEEVSAVEQQVRDLKERVCNLMIVIVDNVTANQEDDSTASMTKAAKDIEKDVEGLLRTLNAINIDLNEISSQNRWLLLLFKDLNRTKIDDCLNQLAVALERFNVTNDLRNAQVLEKLQVRLQKIHGLTQHVADQVDHLHAKFDKFDRILTNLNHSGAHTAMTTLARQQMPVKPRIFHGRDDLTEEMAQLLSNERTSRLCILGPGGMGKTSLALAVVASPTIQARFPSANRFWVPCIEATSSGLFLQILYTNLRISRETQNTLDDILTELNSSKEPRLILLDNFETPWNATDGTQKAVENILCQLDNLSHVAIMVTMRGTYPPSDDIDWQSKNLPPTDQEACRRIFHDINPNSKGDADIDGLLAALGYMPFAVTLMANLGKEGKSSAKELLEEWAQTGTDMLSLSQSPEKSMNRSIGLSVDSHLVKQDPDALLLLATLSLLPAGTTRENLRWWAPALKLTSGAIATLSKAGLLMVNEGETSKTMTLFVLPVLQSFMRLQNRIPLNILQQVQLACCQYVLDHACRYYESTFKENSEAVAAEDTNIQSILLSSGVVKPSISDDKVIKALLAFGWHRNDTKPSLDIVQRTLELAKASEKTRYIAEALFCLGSTYSKLNDFELVKHHLGKAYQLFGHLAHDRDAQRLATECGLIYADSLRYLNEDSDHILEFIQEVQLKIEKYSDEYGRARGLMVEGDCLRYACRYQDSLNSLHEAKDILKCFGYQSDAAQTWDTIAMVYHENSMFSEALEAVEEAIKEAESIDDQYLHAGILETYGFVLIGLERDTDALVYLEKSLMGYQYVGSLLGVAQTLEYMAYAYLRRGDYQDAYAAYEVAIGKYATMGEDSSMGQHGVKQCTLNLSRIRQKQENPEAVVAFLRPCIDRDETLFYPTGTRPIDD